MSWMNRYSLQNLLGPAKMADDPRFGGAGTDPAAVAGSRLQGLMRQKDRMLASQSKSPLGENAPRFYDDMAAINQGIAALGQRAANPKRPLQFAPDRGRVSTMNPVQAGYNAERLAGARVGAQRDVAQARELEIGNAENALSVEQEMADPAFGNMNATRGRTAALARQYSRR